MNERQECAYIVHMTNTIRIEKDYAESGKRPFSAYVNGKLLRKKDGTGRRFTTEEAARKAAEKAAH